jgi:uncharacterized membrane protein
MGAMTRPEVPQDPAGTGRGAIRRLSPWLLAGLLAAAGAMHFAAPDPYIRIVPRALPAPGALVALSGVAELACAVLVAVPRTRRIGGWATAALFVAVFPANVRMALDSAHADGWYRAVVWARLPLQVPLIAWAVTVALGRGRTARVRRT